MYTLTEEDVINYEQLIYSIGSKYKNYKDKEDLFQVGYIGLNSAKENFNDKKGAKFSTYAYSYIKGEMNKHARKDKLIKISRDYSRIYQRLEEAKNSIYQKYMREPTISELSSFLEMDEDLIVQVYNYHYNIKSFDEIIGEDGKTFSLYDTVGSDRRLEVDRLIDLKEALSNLNSIDKKIIEYRYLNDNTQSEVALKLGINQVQVSRLEKRILKRLKNEIN